mmetsp:Transcript_15207/g.30901  ORF Transcript_15207/g.30901 Transcript_15207/m.30901 type:complete len:207 (-) Transcript_15207:63-683(-)
MRSPMFRVSIGACSPEGKETKDPFGKQVDEEELVIIDDVGIGVLLRVVGSVGIGVPLSGVSGTGVSLGVAVGEGEGVVHLPFAAHPWAIVKNSSSQTSIAATQLRINSYASQQELAPAKFPSMALFTQALRFAGAPEAVSQSPVAAFLQSCDTIGTPAGPGPVGGAVSSVMFCAAAIDAPAKPTKIICSTTPDIVICPFLQVATPF